MSTHRSQHARARQTALTVHSPRAHPRTQGYELQQAVPDPGRVRLSAVGAVLRGGGGPGGPGGAGLTVCFTRRLGDVGAAGVRLGAGAGEAADFNFAGGGGWGVPGF
jgi:hypothetical protein